MNRARISLLVVLVWALGGAPTAAAEPDGLALNDIQLLGSHNSYKQALNADTMAALLEVDRALAQSLDYWHLPLREQLEAGIRKLEFDVYYDPGGRLFGRGGEGAAQGPGAAQGAAVASQFPVLHVQNLDDRSNCPHLLDCLVQLVAWSEANPGHLPIFLTLNAKDDVIDQPGFLRPLPFGEDAWMALDAELRAALGDRLITPAEVFAGGRLRWPSLSSARGRALVVLDEGGEKRRQYAGRWRERAMFANLPEDAEGAAVLVVNDPLGEFDRIQGLVRAGFIVRTRADADTQEARTGAVERRDAAFASGAQLISTDYYRPAEHFGTGYEVEMPGGGVGRCNPLRVVPECVLSDRAGAAAHD